MTSQVRQLDSEAGAAELLEHGDVLWQPCGFFTMEAAEQALCSPSVLASGKNVSFDPATGRIGGSALSGDPGKALHGMLSRFSDEAHAVISRLCPQYASQMIRGRTSFRPIEIAGRPSTWRKDDTRLHIDAFPATPVHGRRILRVFANVNQESKPRSWRIGDSFETVARRFAPKLRMPFPGSGLGLSLLRITKTTRSPYDALMLQLHDRMKQDTEYQQTAPQTLFHFPAGSTWMAFTDQVSHAAMSGQYQLEQTFLLPIEAMIDPERSPLRVLEHVKRRRLL
ncbi:MAG TPA: Kdo hydroxylase family protein [Vicinamibacterales bacterium]|nr:Kdo hydroxylase family protein [Vicinamibacterales bacterium]